MKRVLVTGGTGFIGANLTRRLLREGHEVHLAARASSPTSRIRDIARDIDIRIADIEDGDAVRQTVRDIRPEWVFHLAATGSSSQTQNNTAAMIAVNLAGTVS